MGEGEEKGGASKYTPLEALTYLLNLKMPSGRRKYSFCKDNKNGPPPTIKYLKTWFSNRAKQEADKNFKALPNTTAGTTDSKEAKDDGNNEFDSVSQEAIIEAAKAGSQKVSGGGTKEIKEGTLIFSLFKDRFYSISKTQLQCDDDDDFS